MVSFSYRRRIKKKTMYFLAAPQVYISKKPVVVKRWRLKALKVKAKPRKQISKKVCGVL